jgi:hypothetical protein
MELRRSAAIALVGVAFFAGPREGAGQVVAEPALLTAGVPAAETFSLYLAFPEDSYVLGGMIRFPLSADVDVGGRAGLWIIDDGDDTPFVGADVRYGLLSRPLSPGGGQLSLTFDTGLGVSEPGVTLWKIPVGVIAGIGFRLAGGDSEIFIHPRGELGISSGEDEFDSALVLDVGGIFTIQSPLAAFIDFRFGDGPFREGEKTVVALGVAWRL